MPKNEVPELLQDFRVYEDGSSDVKGIVDAQLPSLEALTNTIKGAGIAGEYEAPTPGMYKSMSLALKYRTITDFLLGLSAPKVHALELRGGIQAQDGASGTIRTIPVRVATRCRPKKTDPGKFETGAGNDASNEFDVTYLKITYDGKDMIEIDKINYICIVDGVDYLEELRKAIM